jgi:hypothetical protein
MKKVIIGTPVYGGAHPDFIASLDATIVALAHRGFAIKPRIVTGSLLCHLRNGIAAEFYYNNPDADILLWIDSDERWPVGDAAALLEATSNLPIVAGCYRMKPATIGDLDWRAIAQAAIDGVAHDQLQFVGQRFACGFLPEDISPTDGYVGPFRTSYGRKMVRVAYSGTGFLAITREAMGAIIAKAPEARAGNRKALHGLPVVFNNFMNGDSFDGEDAYFCHLARQCGFEVWMDTECEIDHFGTIGVRGSLKGEWLHDWARREAQEKAA